ncbi:MAG: ABC transporter ATP-binding protein [Candidatus Melainabacteria bacterium]|nr:ABC transporter ATP-binding protein [Candidatus Melainabacteria bacterium]
MNNAVTLNSINKSFGEAEYKNQVLFDIKLNIPLGKISFIVGPSGCGKTTLISIIAGILNQDSGKVKLLDIDQKDLTEKTKSSFRKENIGFIFQQFNLVPTISVIENVAIPLLIQGKGFSEALKRASEILNKVGLKEKEKSLPKNLSGGQQQRVAIARALINEPKIIICDEPTASLDGQTGTTVMELLSSIAKETATTVIIVTHDNRIYNYADRIIEMEDGRIKNVREING